MSEENRYVTEVGKFIAVVKTPGNGWFGEAGAKLSPFIRIPLLVKDGDQTGREIVWRGYITPGAFDNTIKTLTKAFGWDGDIEALTEGTTDPFTGKECSITTEEEEYNGEKRIKVRWLNPTKSAPAMDKAKLKSLAALTKKAKSVARLALEENDEEAWMPEPSKPKAKPTPVEDHDDDIPF